MLANIEAQTLLLLGGPEVDAARRTMAELDRTSRRPRHLAGTISGLDVRYGQACPGEHPLVGRRMPPVEIETALGSTKVPNLLRAGRGLFLDLSGGTAAASDAALPDDLERVNAQGHPDGLMPDLGQVLVRPDGHVAWVAGGAMALSSALQTWFCPPRTEGKGSASPLATAQIQHTTSIKEERGCHAHKDSGKRSDHERDQGPDLRRRDPRFGTGRFGDRLDPGPSRRQGHARRRRPRTRASRSGSR